MSLRIPRSVVLAVAAAAWMAAAQTAGAEESPPPGLTVAEEEALGEEVHPAGEGLYEVEVSGPDLLTHGPDSERLATRSAGGGLGFQPGDAERAPICATDYYQHILYARTPGSPDRLSEVRGQIQSAVRRMNAVLNNSAILNGGVSADYKVLCESDGQIRVDGFTSSSNDFDDIVDAARAAGAKASNADYTVFFDGTAGFCGVGSYIDDERLITSNASNNGGGYAVVYRDCWNSDAAMHENGHAQGAVQYGAPNSTGSGGHCNEEIDVMCYSPDGGDLRQGGPVTRCKEFVVFDCGGDDYFDPNPESGEYLASHWNLGSPMNRFIAFSEAQGGLGGLINDLVGTVAGTVTSLGGKRSGSAKSAPEGEWQYFKTRVRRGTRSMRIRLQAPETVNLDLFARARSKPTLMRFVCTSASNRLTESCRVSRPKPGYWYIGVYTYSGSAGTDFTVRVNQRR